MGNGRGQENNPVHISRTTEVWQGKNDPKERRRIQNRINQRAFRTRKRAGESPKSGTSRESSSEVTASGSSTSGNVERASPSRPAISFPRPTPSWDELGLLISRNLMSAATENATLLGMHPDVLNKGVWIRLQSLSRSSTIPPSLAPVHLQYEVVHDPIFDIIPHPRLRFNIMRAISAGLLDQNKLARSIRQSGLLQSAQDCTLRDGIVLWGNGAEMASWELSDLFFRQFAWLLDSCDDLVQATNVWRSKRGVKPFPLPSQNPLRPS